MRRILRVKALLKMDAIDKVMSHAGIAFTDFVTENGRTDQHENAFLLQRNACIISQLQFL